MVGDTRSVGSASTMMARTLRTCAIRGELSPKHSGPAPSQRCSLPRERRLQWAAAWWSCRRGTEGTSHQAPL